MKEKAFVNFVLLNAYSLESFNLFFGKMGCSLSLFEYSRNFNDELAEKHAFELLQEVLASSMRENTFNEGKMGIAWALIYLINGQYIEAEYEELYGQEHNEILSFIEQIENDNTNITNHLDAIYFLISTKKYVSKSILTKTIYRSTENILAYCKIAPKNIFECDSFYYTGTRIVDCYNRYKELYSYKEKLVSAIVQTAIVLFDEGYMCNNISFGINLLQYGICNKHEDIIQFANIIIECYLSNINFKAIDLKEAIDVTYYINRLQKLNKKSTYWYIEREISNLLLNKESHLYKKEKSELNTLKEGIPRLLLMECLINKNINHNGHFIMLQ